MTDQRSTDKPMTTDMGESRDALLGRVREALGEATAGTPEPPTVDSALVRTVNVEAATDWSAVFARRAEAVGMKVHTVALERLVTRLRELLGQLEARRVGIAAGPLGQRIELELDAALQADDIRQVDWQARPGLDGQYELDVGITDVDAAIAETGTLVCNTRADASRGLSLVPPVHVALVREVDIVPSMHDYFARLAGLSPTQLPSSQVFITGPSKTADIEGELVTGVHGPGVVHIFLIAGA